MPSLFDEIPDADVLLQLAPEQLGRVLLRLARGHAHNGMFLLGHFAVPSNPAQPWYPHQQRYEIDVAVQEAWLWLQLHLLVIPAPEPDGRSGWMVFGRRASALTTDESFNAFANAVKFPRELVHPRIRDKVCVRIAEGDLDAAVLHAFKQVEVRVREAAGLDATDVGAKLVRKAFDPTDGPLSNLEQPQPERAALAELFVAALGSYRNPHSHRNVDIQDVQEAQEMVIFASHLLGIVDAREALRAANPAPNASA